MAVLDMLTQVLTEPAIMVALIAFLGLFLLRSPIEKIFSETIKTALGMYIILAGVDLLFGSVGVLPTILGHGFHPDVVLPAEGSAVEIIGGYGAQIAWIMLVALVVNLLLARITPLKYVYLSGHIIWQNAIILIAMFLTIFKTTSVTTAHIIIIGIFLGIYDTVMPALVQPWARKVTGGDDFALAHSINIGCIVGGWLGSVLGNKEKSAETIKFPKRLSFMSDPGVVAAVIFLIVFFIGTVLSGAEYISTFSGDKNWLVWTLSQSLNGSAGILLIFFGAKTMLAAIVPAFRGISQKLIPNAIPALDMPVFFSYAPTALLIGAITSLFAQLITMMVFGFTLPAVVVFPAMIATFFEGGTVGIFGNATGGLRGCVISSFVVGVINMVGLALVLPFTRMVGDWMRILAFSDYGTIFPAIGALVKLLLN